MNILVLNLTDINQYNLSKSIFQFSLPKIVLNFTTLISLYNKQSLPLNVTSILCSIFWKNIYKIYLHNIQIPHNLSSPMLARFSFHNKKSQKKTDNIHIHHTSQNNEKQNNQQNLNRVKRSLKLSELEPLPVLKPVLEKSYSTNVDNKLTLMLNFNSTNTTGASKGKLSARCMQSQSNKKQALIEKQKPQSITEQFYQLYGKDIIQKHEIIPFQKTEFLKKHEIDSHLRARMLDWMVEVTKSYKFINKSYFSSVQLMDNFFMASNQSIPVSQLHITGVTAMYIASKMDEIYPLKIKTIYEKIVHKKISKEALIETEKKMFDTLDHRVNCWTFFDLALLKVSDQFSHDNVELKNNVEEVMSFISKFILYDYELYLKYDMETFAKVLAKIATKICGLKSKGDTYSVSCHEEIVKLYRKFKTNYKGINNLFKFTDDKVIEAVDAYFVEEARR